MIGHRQGICTESIVALSLLFCWLDNGCFVLPASILFPIVPRSLGNRGLFIFSLNDSCLIVAQKGLESDIFSHQQLYRGIPNEFVPFRRFHNIRRFDVLARLRFG